MYGSERRDGKTVRAETKRERAGLQLQSRPPPGGLADAAADLARAWWASHDACHAVVASKKPRCPTDAEQRLLRESGETEWEYDRRLASRAHKRAAVM